MTNCTTWSLGIVSTRGYIWFHAFVSSSSCTQWSFGPSSLVKRQDIRCSSCWLSSAILLDSVSISKWWDSIENLAKTLSAGSGPRCYLSPHSSGSYGASCPWSYAFWADLEIGSEMMLERWWSAYSRRCSSWTGSTSILLQSTIDKSIIQLTKEGVLLRTQERTLPYQLKVLCKHLSRKSIK